MKLFIAVAVASGLAVCGAAYAGSKTGHFEGEALVAKAPVTMSQAQDLALKARPGKIVKREAEKEAGGSGLRYSFDIKAKGKTFEVGVDSQTGAILENGTESATDEAKEAKDEK